MVDNEATLDELIQQSMNKLHGAEYDDERQGEANVLQTLHNIKANSLYAERFTKGDISSGN